MEATLGKHENAKIVDYGLGITEKQKLFAWIQFNFTDQAGNNFEKVWRGYMSEGATKFTIENLVRCGFRGTQQQIPMINNGPQSGTLNMNQLYTIKLDKEVYADPSTGQQKESVKITSIFLPGEKYTPDRIDQGQLMMVMQGMNLESILFEAKKKSTQNKSTVQTQRTTNQPATKIYNNELDPDSIPF